ncbi:thiamine pyrophosphate-binding protein [Dietzia aurantiaca]|uniref:acetolactate synthase n=1 Tax=Dietzia aurantiaca TaxID=983873 RepID=A0ABV9PLZ1_9ACTN
MYFHQSLAQALRDQGVEDVFGVLGDANLYMFDSFDKLGGRFLSVANEAGGVLAANGYARITGGLGVATVTHGPALTNTVTALVESVKDRTPVLVVAGDTAVEDRENFQNISQRDVVLPTGAGFEQVRAPHTVSEDVAVAVRRAHLERRPIVLNVPIEFQWTEVEHVTSVPRVPARQAVRPDPEAVEEAVGAIASARRPLILAGQGAASDGAREALVRLAERIGAPLATSLRGRDLFRGERFNIGIVGTLSHSIALDTVASADLIVSFGAGLNPWTTAERSVVDSRRIVQVDIDPAALHRFQRADAAVCGDVGEVADAFVALLDEAEVPPTSFASEELATRLAEHREDAYKDLSTEETVDTRTALLRIDREFPRDRALVIDGGRFALSAFRIVHVEHPRNYIHTVNFGSIGLGMGNAIGVARGTDKPTLLLAGDGGFMLGGLAEFNTAVRHGLDIVVFIFNDMAYGAEHIQFRNKDMDPALSTFDWPDLGPVATALGGQGLTVRSLDDLDEVFAAIERRDRPILVDIKIDPDRVQLFES